MNYTEQQKQLNEANLEARFLSGRFRSGNDSHGTLVHATEKDLDFGKAICGRQQSPRSNGWYPALIGDGTKTYEPVTCEKCLKKLALISSGN